MADKRPVLEKMIWWKIDGTEAMDCEPTIYLEDDATVAIIWEPPTVAYGLYGQRHGAIGVRRLGVTSANGGEAYIWFDGEDRQWIVAASDIMSALSYIRRSCADMIKKFAKQRKETANA
jgi:hypothetical protein